MTARAPISRLLFLEKIFKLTFEEKKSRLSEKTMGLRHAGAATGSPRGVLGPTSSLLGMRFVPCFLESLSIILSNNPQVRITVFDDGLEGKDLPTGFNADVEGKIKVESKLEFYLNVKTYFSDRSV